MNSNQILICRGTVVLIVLFVFFFEIILREDSQLARNQPRMVPLWLTKTLDLVLNFPKVHGWSL
ncbi:hypothetical protein HanRHA438_Chr12g0554481 [Helianthus annuus]|nr:hypothetical protein HanRHA438_Chr12g0554481 [Helianthus annuus]